MEQLSRRLHQHHPLPHGRGFSCCTLLAATGCGMQVCQLDMAQAAYIAGLVDGEGTITLTRKHRNEHRQLAVSISSTERQLLEFVKSATGFGKITNKRRSDLHHSPSFTYAVYNRQALALIEKINPYLQSYKKCRANLILENYVQLTPRNGKYSKSLLAKKTAFEEALLKVKANVN